MKENNDDKNIINIFAAHHNKSHTETTRDSIKYFAGFNYVKLNKDKNGTKFNKERLCRDNFDVLQKFLLTSSDIIKKDLTKN